MIQVEINALKLNIKGRLTITVPQAFVSFNSHRNYLQKNVKDENTQLF